MTTTPNFGLEQPEQGTAEWHIPLNTNFEALDKKLPIVDTYANRSNYSPSDGQAYLAQDLGVWFHYDAASSSWATADKFLVVEDSELQSKLDEAAQLTTADADRQRVTVRLREGLVVDTGSTIRVPPGVFLDGRNATFEPSGDYDLVFLDNGSGCDIRALTDDSYTSRVCYVDSSEARDGKYTLDTTQNSSMDSGVEAHVEHINVSNSNPTSGVDNGVTFEAKDSAGKGIGLAVQVNLKSYRIGTALSLNLANGGWANFMVHMQAASCHTMVHSKGDGDANSQITGELQPTNPTHYGIRHEASGAAPKFNGLFWDPWNYSTYSLAGGGVSVMTEVIGVDRFRGTTDGSHYMTAINPSESEGWAAYDPGSNTSWRFDFKFSSFRIRTNDGSGYKPIFDLDANGDLRVAGTVSGNQSM